MVSKCRTIWKQTVAQPSVLPRLARLFSAAGALSLAAVVVQAIRPSNRRLSARSSGAWPYNQPCTQQYVGKSQSCMVISDRLIVHALDQCWSRRARVRGRWVGGRLRSPPENGVCAYSLLERLRVRFHIIRTARIKTVGKYQSCMVSKLPMIWKQTVRGQPV